MDQKSFHTSKTPTTRGRTRSSPGRHRSARCRRHTSPTSRSPIDWCSYIKPAYSGEDGVPSPAQVSFHTSTTPTTRGRKRWSPGSIPPRTVWKPQPHWLIADWLGLMEPARGESCPSGQRRGPATRGRYGPISDQKSFHISKFNHQGTKNDCLLYTSPSPRD